MSQSKIIRTNFTKKQHLTPLPISMTKARFPLPELTARVVETGHPSTRAVNSGRQLG